MTPDLDVDVGAVRAGAAQLDQTAAQLATGLAVAAPLSVGAPGWASAAALTDLTAAASSWVAGLAGRAEQTAHGVRAAAAAYEAADARAAARLRAGR